MLEGNIWFLEGNGIGYILCSGCAKKWIAQSKFGLYKPRKKVGWRTIQLSFVRKFLKREWEPNMERTRQWVQGLLKQLSQRQHLQAVCNAAAETNEPPKKRKPRTRKRASASTPVSKKPKRARKARAVMERTEEQNATMQQMLVELKTLNGFMAKYLADIATSVKVAAENVQRILRSLPPQKSN